ncbi:MAG TPA: CHRD domain-containing protein [Luteimonas sp.]|nr:CHRD domain-containing protein [Luteimonas sp.]
MNVRSCLPALLLAACIGQAGAAELRLHAILNGANVVSATDSKATGEASAVLQDDGKVRINLVFGGLASDVTSAALHAGTSAENGPAAMPLEVRKNQTVGSLVDAELALSEDVELRMRDGETYIVVNTIDHPAGAIRGQLLPQPVRLGDEPEEVEK